MKIIHTSRIEFSEAGPGLCTGFFRHGPKDAVCGPGSLRKSRGRGPGRWWQRIPPGCSNAFGAKISAYPGPGDSLKVTTWSRGFKGVRAFRDFSIVCNGRPVARCSSVWLRISLKNKRILKITPEMMAPYTQETETVVGHLLENFKPGEKQAGMCLYPWLSGHRTWTLWAIVNHSVFFDFLDTPGPMPACRKTRAWGFSASGFSGKCPPRRIARPLA